MVASESVDVVVVGASRAGVRWFCPTSHPVRVHTDGLYYPDEYPRGYNLLERPQGCYLNTELAEREGFTLGDPPPGVVVAGGVYVEDASSPSDAACRQLANQATYAVPCPSRLPTPGIGPSCIADSCMYGGTPDRTGRRLRKFSIVMEQRAFRLPDTWPADEAQVIVAAAAVTRENEDGTLRVPIHPELVTCNAGTEVRSTPEVTIVECPAGQRWIPRIQGDPHEGNTAAFWRGGNAAYAVSVEGYGPDVRALLDDVVEGLRFYGAVIPDPPVSRK